LESSVEISWYVSFSLKALFSHLPTIFGGILFIQPCSKRRCKVSDIKFLNSVLKESDDYAITSTKEIYVGNIDSDDYETADYDLYVTSKKNVDLLLQYTFLDANNKEYVKNVKLKLNLYSASQAKKLGFMKSSSGSGIFVILIIIIGGGYFYIKKIKKKSIKDYFKIK